MCFCLRVNVCVSISLSVCVCLSAHVCEEMLRFIRNAVDPLLRGARPDLSAGRSQQRVSPSRQRRPWNAHSRRGRRASRCRPWGRGSPGGVVAEELIARQHELPDDLHSPRHVRGSAGISRQRGKTRCFRIKHSQSTGQKEQEITRRMNRKLGYARTHIHQQIRCIYTYISMHTSYIYVYT